MLFRLPIPPVAKLRTIEGPTALLLAVNQRPPDVIRFLFHESDLPNLLPAALHRIDLVTALLSKGARVNVTDDEGDTPLIIAALNGDTEMMNLLLTNGASINARNRQGETALIAAASRWALPHDIRAAAVKLLLKRGADPTIRSSFFGTAIDQARDDISLTSMLLDVGSKK